MTPNDQIKIWRAAAEAATEGPWTVSDKTTVWANSKRKYIVPPDDMRPEEMREEDAEFIALARQAVPALCDMVERRDKALEEAKEIIMTTARIIEHLGLPETAQETKEQATHIDKILEEG